MSGIPIYIYGDVPEEKARELCEEEPYLFGFYPPDEEYDKKKLMHHKGASYVRGAVNIWHFFDKDKWRQLGDLLQNGITAEEYYIYDFGYPMSQEDIQELITLLDGACEALRTLTDPASQTYRVLPEYVDYIKQKDSSLLDIWTDADGNKKYHLWNSQAKLKGVTQFLHLGLQMMEEHECEMYWGQYLNPRQAFFTTQQGQDFGELLC